MRTLTNTNAHAPVISTHALAHTKTHTQTHTQTHTFTHLAAQSCPHSKGRDSESTKQCHGSWLAIG